MRQSKLVFLVVSSICILLISFRKKEIESPNKPNVIIVYTDDLGYGDVGAYYKGRSITPNIDKLANGGIRFTDGHSTSSTCTPSRYGLLTGVYPWRNADAKILPGTAPLIISTKQNTIAKLFKTNGYKTAVIGKWHLGLGKGDANWNKEITPNPNQLGFDYSYILAATQDRVPTVYIKNGNVVGLNPNDPISVNYDKKIEGMPNAIDNPELLTLKWDHGHNNTIVNGISRIGFMKGGKEALWSDIDMADVFWNETKNFIKKNKTSPFFLYYALQQPHVPRTPNPRFVGSSGMGSRGDAIVEADWCVGELMKTLDEEGLLENTLIVFSSDNGPVLNDGYVDGAVELLGGHNPFGPLRGGKYSLFEAGTRVPFITYWKGVIKPKVSNALVCQLDLLASFAQLLGVNTEVGDSKNILNSLLGVDNKGRKDLVLEASSRTALRKDSWLMIPPYKGAKIAKEVNIELGNSDEYLLFNLKTDIGQKNNLANKNAKKLEEMKAEYKIQLTGIDNKPQKLELK